METLSRVKRFEDLRKQIEDESIGTDTPPQEKLQDYAQRLNEIDPSIFRKVKITEEEPYTPERERIVTGEEQEESDSAVGEFRNEYLDDFINEVREYNIKKGNRDNEDTQIDILNRLNSVSRAKRSDYVQNITEEVSTPIKEDTVTLDREEIAEQVKSLLNEETEQISKKNNGDSLNAQPINSKQSSIENTNQIARAVSERAKVENTNRMKQIQQESEAETLNVTDTIHQSTLRNDAAVRHHPFVSRKNKPTVVASKEEQEEAERERRLHQKLVEETEQLRVQLNEYEDDLNDLSEGVEKTNKMLNVILGCLILALLVIIGIIIYWIVQAGGLV